METDKEPLLTLDKLIQENDHDGIVIQHEAKQNQEESIDVCLNNYQDRSPRKQSDTLAMLVHASILVLVLYLVFGNRGNCKLVLKYYKSFRLYNSFDIYNQCFITIFIIYS